MVDDALAVVVAIPMPMAELAARADIAVAVSLLRVVRPISYLLNTQIRWEQSYLLVESPVTQVDDAANRSCHRYLAGPGTPCLQSFQ